jgi:DNA-binding winged helix-turn-helix (wHTH) protein/Tfp pilus assembly protein PilF/TolB-like protein
MGTQPPTHPAIRFGSFELDPDSVELHRDGVRVRIQEQPLKLLSVLLESPGRVVTRQELQKRLWPDNTFVDFEDGLNTAIKKLREALGDEKDNPRFIETVPRHGYRFIEQVEIALMALPDGDHAAANVSSLGGSSKTQSRQRIWIALGVAVLILGGLSVWLTISRPAFSFGSRDWVLVSDFENGTGEPQLGDALQTAFIVSLEQSRHFNVFPRTRIASVLQLMGKPADARITPALALEICQRENIRGLIAGNITRTGQEYGLSAELIDPQTGNTVRSYSQRAHGEDRILEALDRISGDAREDLGESLYQIHNSNRSLPQVTTSSLTALKEYAEGMSLWHEGKFKDGATRLRAAVAADSDFAMAHAALGGIYFSYVTNDQPAGRREYDKALALSLRTTERERLRIQVDYAADLDHVDSAENLYRLYLDRYPDDWQVLSDYARLMRTHARQQEAIARYQEILRVAPDDAKTYVEIATANLNLGKFPEALRAYSEAFKLSPQWLTTGNINREYGFTLVENGEDEKAEQTFSALLSDPKTRETGLRSLAFLDLYHGRYTNARSKFQDALLLDESPPAAFSIARVHLGLGMVAEGQGNTREELKQLDAASAQLRDIGPKVVFGAIVGFGYARAKATAQAESIEKLIAPLADPKSGEQIGYLHLLQGEIALAEGHSAQAINLLTLADHDNSTAFSIEALAHTYQQSGATDQAILWFEKLISPPTRALSWEPQQKWVAAHLTLAEDYLARGERDKANQVLTKLLGMWKDADPDLPLRKQAVNLRSRIS